MINTSANVGDPSSLIPDRMPNVEKKTVGDILNFQKDDDGKKKRKRLVALHKRRAKIKKNAALKNIGI